MKWEIEPDPAERRVEPRAVSWVAGRPPYALARLLDDKCGPRVAFTAGDPAEVAVVRRIFRDFVELGSSEYRIAEGLNTDGILSPTGGRWGAGLVRRILDNEKNAGEMIYNRTSANPSTPISLPDAFAGLVTREQFERARRR